MTKFFLIILSLCFAFSVHASSLMMIQGGVPAAGGGGGSFPVTSVLETFTGTDNTTPPNASWTNYYLTIKILSNTAAGSTISDFNSASYNGTYTTNDVEVYATVSTVPGASQSIILGVFDNALVHGYFLQAIKQTGADILRLYRGDFWTKTQIGTDRSQEYSNGDSLGLYVHNGTIKIYYKAGAGSWAQVGADFTDSTYSDGTKIMLSIMDTTARIDNLGGGTP